MGIGNRSSPPRRRGAASPWGRGTTGIPSLLLAIALLASAPVSGQVTPRGTGPALHSMVFRDVPVARALETLVATTGIDLLYGPEVPVDRPVFCRADDQTAEAILACILRSAGLDYYRLSSGTYVVIAAVEAVPAWGSLVGVVRDRWSGEPLPGARIEVLETPGGLLESNGAGLFALGRLLPGRHDLHVTSPGYAPLRASFLVPPRGEARLSLELEARPLALRPVVVDGVQGTLRREPAGGVLVEGERSAGGLVEPLAASAPRLAPGLSLRPLLSDLHIQGGDPGEHEVRLDGVPIYNPVTVQGLLGTFSPLALERLTVRKAGFPARAGSATAGIVEFQQRAGSDVVPELDLQVDPLNVHARGAVPLALAGGRGAAMVAVRSTLWDRRPVRSLERTLEGWTGVDPLLTASLLGPEEASVEALDYRSTGDATHLGSHDLHLAARLTTPSATTLSLSGYRGSSRVGSEVVASGHHPGDPTVVRLMAARDRYEWTNTAARLRLDALVGSRTTLWGTVRGVRHDFRSGYAMVDAHQEGMDPSLVDPSTLEPLLRERRDAALPLLDGNRVEEIGGGVGAEVAVAPGHRLHLGVDMARVEASLRLGGLYPLRRAESGTTRLGAVVEHRYARGPLLVEVGSRVTRPAAGVPAAWEPRLALELEGEVGGGSSGALRLAGGEYRQFVSLFELANPGPSALVPSLRFWLPVGGGVPAARARHLSLEGLFSPAEGWELRGEAYWKELGALPALDYDALLSGSLPPGAVDPALILGNGRGSARGAGIRIAREGPRLRVRTGYDRTDARRSYPSRFGGDEVPSPVDAPHRILAAAEVEPSPSLVVRLRAESVWGRGWGFRRAYYDLLTRHDGRPDLGVGRPGETRLPPLQEVDLGISWRGRTGRARIEASLDLLNVLDRENVMDYGLRRAAPGGGSPWEREARTLPGITSLLAVRISY